MTTSPLSFGWYCPTTGDTSEFGDPAKSILPTFQHFMDVAEAAEAAGFEYLLTPVLSRCWDAWVVASCIAARTTRIKPLVAMKPGFIHPVAQAKMIATLDQVSQGRVYINLIAGLSELDAIAEGQRASKTERYEQLEEEVVLIKRLLSEEAVQHEGKYYKLDKPLITPKAYQKPYPPFFLGGGSDQAAEISARHSAVHLFWGDHPQRIAEQVSDMRKLAARYGREQELQYGMRLQVVCRETEAAAWDAAHTLVANAEQARQAKANRVTNSVADARQQELAKTPGGKLTPHLWTGISEVRSGAGLAVVGDPGQVANQLREFVEAGCTSFCLSGFPHHREARRFGELVMPRMKQ